MNTRRMVTAAIGALTALAAQQVVAGEGAAIGEGMGLLTIIFLAVAAIVVVGQVIPAVVMFGSMLLSLFSPARAKARAEKKTKQAV